MIYPFRSRRYLRSYQTIFLFICTLSCCHSLSTTRLHRRTLFKALAGAEHAGDLAKVGKQVHGTVTDSKTVFSGGHVNLPKFHERLPTIPEHPAPLPNKPPPTHFLPPKSEHLPPNPGRLPDVPPTTQIPGKRGTLAELFAQEDLEEKELLLQKEIIELARVEKGKPRNSGNRWSEILRQLKSKNKEAYKSVTKWFRIIKRRSSTRPNGKTAQIPRTVEPSRTAGTLGTADKAVYNFEDGIAELGRAAGGEYHLALPNKKPFNLEEMIDYLVPVGDSGSIEERKNMKQLMTLLQQKEQDDKYISIITEEWDSLQGQLRNPNYVENSASQQVKRFIGKLNEFSETLNNEREAAVRSITKQAKWRLDSNPDSYMKDYFKMNEEEQSALLEDFARWRAIQTTPRDSLDPLLKLVGSLPKFAQRVPEDADLESEFFRFTMLKNFEEILRQFNQKSDSRIVRSLEGRLTSKRIESSQPESLKSVFASTAKEDIEWREDLFVNAHPDRLTPSEMFAKLQGQTDDAGRINYAFRRNPDSLSFLSDEEKRALRSTRDRREFRKKRHELEAKYSKPEQIKALKEFEKQAIHSDPVNHPYAEELFQKGLIDQATRDKLNPLKLNGQLTQSKFLELLGTSEQFKTLVMTQFEKNLVEGMKTATRTEIKKIKSTTASKLSSALSDELISATKATYLTRKALLEPNSVDFGQVLRSFTDELDKLGTREINPNQLTKAYVEAQFHLGRIESPDLSPFLALFDELKIPADPSYTELLRKALEGAEGRIFSELNGFDPRFLSLAERPLQLGDPRLRDTKFQYMTKTLIETVNNLAKEILGNLHLLDRTIARNKAAQEKIDALISSFSADQVKRLTPLINQVLENKETPKKVSHIFTPEDLKKKNDAVKASLSHSNQQDHAPS